jgi:hypothetical protein
MFTLGELASPPSLAIFADTGWEPPVVYRWLYWLESRLAFPVHRVKAAIPRLTGNIRADTVGSATGGRFVGMPLYTESDGGRGMLRRQCTSEYKITPIEQHIRRDLLATKRVPRGVRVEQSMGISLDEVHRVKPSQVSWIERRWPLVFEARMTRADCLRWMQSRGYPMPPRSACIGCPYHSDAEWRRMKNGDPDSWADAVEFDKIIRTDVQGIIQKCYLHSSLKPLDEVDLSTPEDHGQLSLFTEECEGMCGV